jgi:hypothetical protein
MPFDRAGHVSGPRGKSAGSNWPRRRRHNGAHRFDSWPSVSVSATAGGVPAAIAARGAGGLLPPETAADHRCLWLNIENALLWHDGLAAPCSHRVIAAGSELTIICAWCARVSIEGGFAARQRE